MVQLVHLRRGTGQKGYTIHKGTCLPFRYGSGHMLMNCFLLLVLIFMLILNIYES